MTIKELIQELQQLPNQDARIFVDFEDRSGHYHSEIRTPEFELVTKQKSYSCAKLGDILFKA